jgi:uncharacterized protein (TIGR02217 family)
VPAPPSFPSLKGQAWSVHRKPSFSTRVGKHVSGREVRAPYFTYPLYEYEVAFDALDAGSAYPGLDASSLQSLMGLYLQCQGSYGTFLYTDPSDHSVTAQAIAVGDGAKTVFSFVRTFGGSTEPASYVTSVSNVYLNGVNQTSGWTLTAPRTLTFTSAPGAGVVITATFAYAFECRFLEDQTDFENFANGLWRVESLKFRSVKS